MKSKFIIGGLISLFVVLVIGGTWVSAHNGEIEKRNKVEAQQKACEANFDKMFKSIAQVAEVTKTNMEESKKAFKEIYPELMEGRYSNERGGALMSWVSESNPQFDLNATTSLYSKLANTIEANRDAYFLEQKKLISYKEEYDTYIAKFPNSIFVGGDDIDIVVITSEKTEQVYSEGQENDIKVFN
jgi:hypothetical protein